MVYVANPAWVDRFLSRHLDALRKRFGAELMPTASGKKFKELGCGHYGCVLPTSVKELVFKVTSDPSEAAFVTAATSIAEKDKGRWPSGIVRYHGIVELPELYRKRPVFCIVRESAHGIGFVYRKTPPHDYDATVRSELAYHLAQFKSQAAIVRSYLTGAKIPVAAIDQLKRHEDAAWKFTRDDKAYALKGALKAAVALQNCEDIAETMEHTYGSSDIGATLGFYIEHGMLLADVHANNVGMATRPPDDEYDSEHTLNVITDPGHMVPLDVKWLQVSVPQL